MYKTAELIEKLKKAYNLSSDYAAAKKIGISPQTLSNYVNSKRSFDNKMAVEIAELLDLNPFDVIVSMDFERACKKGDPSLISFWQRYDH